MKRPPVMAVILLLAALAWLGAMLYQAGYKEGLVYSYKAAIEQNQKTEEVPNITPPTENTQTHSE